MIILFILPAVGRKPGQPYIRSWQMEPVAIAQLASLTPARHTRLFMDDRMEELDYDTAADLVAINIETYTAKRAYAIAAQFRRRGIPVVMGGFHATLVPDEVSQHADAVVIGEAEGVWAQLLEDAEHGALKPRYQSPERPQLTGLRPDRTIYADKHYLPLGLVETARGCPHTCEFCSISSFFAKSYAARPVADVITEIRLLHRRNLFFMDDNLCAIPARARELFVALRPLNIRWMGQVTLAIAKDPELLQLMRDSGCVGVLIGFESLNQRNLEAMGKTMNVGGADYDACVGELRKFGICVYGTFVFGYDADDENTFSETYAFALRNKLFFAAFNHLVPFPGTPLYQRLAVEKRLLYDAWWLADDYRFGDIAFTPKRLSPQRLAELCLEQRKRFYAYRSILTRGLDWRANCRGPFRAGLFFSQNIQHRREMTVRQGLPLG